MSPTRREFMRIVGLTVATLLTSRCKTSTSLPTPGSPRERVRNCWLRLEWLEQQGKEPNWSEVEQVQSDLIAQHRTALDELIAAGEIDPTVAGFVQIAFDAAAHYNGITIVVETVVECYAIQLEEVTVTPPALPIPTPTATPTPTPVPMHVVAGRKLAEYVETCESRLARQADLLSDMAEQSDLDHLTIERVQSAIQRDLTLVTLSRQTRESLLDQMVRAAGDTNNFPVLDELDVEISPEAAAATRFLVDLLFEEQQ